MYENSLRVCLFCLTATLAACGSSEDSTPISIMPIEPIDPTFSLAVSDAPVDGLSDVILCFSTVTLTGEDEDIVLRVGDADFGITANDLCLDDTNNVVANAVGINLLDYTGSDSVSLVENISIEPGQYSEIQLGMADGSYTVDKLDQTKTPLTVPSNEIALDGFSVIEDASADFTVEFDLRAAITSPEGQDGYVLQSTGIRLVDNLMAGNIEGQVTETVLINNLCEPLADINGTPAAVYLYQDINLDPANLGDNGGSDNINPFASASVSFDSSESRYPFDIGFVPFGEYTLAMSCNIFDDPEQDDEINFLQVKEITVDSNNMTTSVVFNGGG